MNETRPATDSDFPHFLELVPELHVDDPPPTFEHWWRELAPTTLFAVAPPDPKPSGYIFFQVLTNDLYVRHLVTAPGHRRRGVGRTLLLAAMTRAEASPSIRDVRLNVKVDNETALRLYASLGLAIRFETNVLRVSPETISRLPPSDEAAIEIRAEELTAVERDLGLVTGSLSMHVRPSKILLAVRRGGRFEGVASFDPRFPGAFPFRASAPRYARAIAEAMLQRRGDFVEPDPSSWRHASVQIVVEDDERLATELTGAGASHVLRIAHMSAPLDIALAKARAAIS